MTNYLRAFRLVQDNLRDPAGLPISVRLLCEAHRLLLDGVRGSGKQPGELRRSQNWIGGTRPGNAALRATTGRTGAPSCWPIWNASFTTLRPRMTALPPLVQDRAGACPV